MMIDRIFINMSNHRLTLNVQKEFVIMTNYKIKVDEFDKYSKNYRSVHDNNIKISGANSDYFSEYKVKIISDLENINIPNDIKILDLGCGDGNSLKYFRDYFPNALLYGLDISSASIDEAIKKNILNTIISTYNGVNIPYDFNSFDIVFLSGVIHHVPTNFRENLLAEIYRVLKTTGRLYIFEHNPFNPVTRKIVHECIFDENANLISASNLKSLLVKNGFKYNLIKYTVFFPKHKIFKLFNFIEEKITWIPLGGQYYIKSNKNLEV